MLKKIALIRVERNVRSFKDYRKKVDRYIVEYRDENGDEYRKSFEVKRGEKPIIPDTI